MQRGRGRQPQSAEDALAATGMRERGWEYKCLKETAADFQSALENKLQKDDWEQKARWEQGWDQPSSVSLLKLSSRATPAPAREMFCKKALGAARILLERQEEEGL